METEGTILEQFEKSTEQENDVKQEQVEQVSHDVEEHAPEIEVHETNAESSYEEAKDKEPVEVKEEEETAEQVEEPKEEEVEETKEEEVEETKEEEPKEEEEPAESQEPKEEVEKSTKDSKEEDEDEEEEEDSKDSKDDEEDDEEEDKDDEDKAKKSESDMFEAIKSIIDSSMARIDERITQLEDTVTKGLVTETVESEPVEQEVEPKVEAETIKEEEPVEEVTEAEPEAVIEAEEVEEPKEEEEPAEVEEEEVTSKSVKVATQNRENDDEQAIKSVIQDDEDAVGYASKDASRIQETLEEETTEEETAKSFDGVAQTTEVKENPQEFMTENRQAFLDELSKAYKSSGFSNGYREDLRRAFLDINNGSQNKEQFELVKSFLNK